MCSWRQDTWLLGPLFHLGHSWHLRLAPRDHPGVPQLLRTWLQTCSLFGEEPGQSVNES